MRILLLLVVSLLIMASCRSTPTDPVESGIVDQSGQQTLLEGMTRRSELLQQLHGYGVIELRWSDQDGDHFEQGDVEFWLDGQQRRSMRISKLGEPYFWIGTDGDTAWVFDLSSSPRQLLVDRLATIEASEAEEAGIASISQIMRILPLGIGTLPPSDMEEIFCREAGDGDWWLEFRTAGSKMARETLTIDSNTWRPTRVSLLNANGTAGMVLRTPSNRMLRVDIPDRSSLGSPLVSAILEIEIKGDSSARAKFALEKLSTDMSEQPLDRLFDLAVLRQALQPEVEGPLVGSDTGDRREP